ncbi:MAG TPA: class I SAM-dependent methyltransferase [Bacillota bacterium]|nr:class I SAM-dependent methyltransferase [Bacillota bacterium]
MNEFDIGIKEKDFVLDVGCWGGARVSKLSSICNNVYGIDINTERFKLADKETRKRLFFGDVEKGIPLKMKFDWIFLTEVLEHLKNDKLALKNISKSLKKNGKLILTTTKSIRFFEFYDPAWIRWKFGGERHYHYTKEELFKKLEKNNLVVNEYSLKGNLIWVIIRWINVFLRYVLRLKFQINIKTGKGFCQWIILAKRK